MGFQGLDWRRGLLPVRNEGGLYSTHLLTAEVERIVSQHDPNTPLFLYLPYQGTVFPFILFFPRKCKALFFISPPLSSSQLCTIPCKRLTNM